MEVGREGAGQGERTPSQSIFPCPRGLDPLTILFSPLGPALSFCMEGAVCVPHGQLPSVRVSSGLQKWSRPWSLLLPRFELAVS